MLKKTVISKCKSSVLKCKSVNLSSGICAHSAISIADCGRVSVSFCIGNNCCGKQKMFQIMYA